MEEGSITSQIPVPTDHQTAEVSQPGKESLHLPAALVAPELAAILCSRFDAVAAMGTDQFNAAFGEAFPQWIRVGRTVINQPHRLVFGASFSLPRHLDLRQHRLNKCHFPRRSRVEVGRQRNSLAACHHHPLCTLSAFGLSDAAPPFLAGAKLPSAKHSSQSNRCFSSNSARSVRQSLSHKPWSSHSKSRRRQVEYDGYSSGKSFHRAPERNTHKIPSKHGRLGTGVGPPFDDFLGSGSKAASLAHCSSLSSGFLIGDSFRRIVNHNSWPGANL